MNIKDKLNELNNSDIVILFPSFEHYYHFCRYANMLFGTREDEDIIISIWQDRESSMLAVKIIDEDWESVSIQKDMMAIYWTMPDLEDMPPYLGEEYDCVIWKEQ